MSSVYISAAVSLAISLLEIIAAWKIYHKARQPGWGSLVPIYNLYLWMKIAGKPGWWTVLIFIPVVNLVILFIAAIAIARAFGHGVGFGVCMVLFGPVMLPILGYGSSSYTPPLAAA